MQAASRCRGGGGAGPGRPHTPPAATHAAAAQPPLAQMPPRGDGACSTSAPAGAWRRLPRSAPDGAWRHVPRRRCSVRRAAAGPARGSVDVEAPPLPAQPAAEAAAPGARVAFLGVLDGGRYTVRGEAALPRIAPDALFQLLCDYEAAPRIFSNVSSSEVTSRTPGGADLLQARCLPAFGAPRPLLLLADCRRRRRRRLRASCRPPLADRLASASPPSPPPYTINHETDVQVALSGLPGLLPDGALDGRRPRRAHADLPAAARHLPARL